MMMLPRHSARICQLAMPSTLSMLPRDISRRQVGRPLHFRAARQHMLVRRPKTKVTPMISTAKYHAFRSQPMARRLHYRYCRVTLDTLARRRFHFSARDRAAEHLHCTISALSLSGRRHTPRHHAAPGHFDIECHTEQ